MRIFGSLEGRRHLLASGTLRQLHEWSRLQAWALNKGMTARQRRRSFWNSWIVCFWHTASLRGNAAPRPFSERSGHLIHVSIIELLYSQGEVSLAQTAQNLFAKSLLLIAASHFEDRLKRVVTSGVAARSRNDPYINAFFKMRGISYQYHAWFDWDKGNANRFYSFFGKQFVEAIKSMIDDDKALSECVTNFVKISDLRNRIVHNNILVFKLDDTPAQVLEHIKAADLFISLVEKVFDPKRESEPFRLGRRCSIP